MRYQIRYTDEAKRALPEVPGNNRQRLRRIVESLADVPRPPEAVGLRDRPHRYKIKLDSGKSDCGFSSGWRLIFEDDDEARVVFILRVRRKTGPATYEGLDE